jgi:hypothetical protein
MKFNELYESVLLEEGLSPVLFHHTDIWSLLSILEMDAFKLSPVFDALRDQELNLGRMFYLSTSRTRTASYRFSRMSASTTSVFLTLDGKKFSNNFKGAPVDFFGKSDRERKSKPYEQEDRIVSNKELIPNALSYITKIEIFKEDNKVPRGLNLDHLVNLTKGKIPVLWYKDKQSYTVGNAAKALDIRLLRESDVVEEASFSTNKWIAENVPKEYRRPLIATINMMGKLGVSLTTTNYENQVRTIAKLYNVDFMMLMSFLKKLSMLIM